jgi:hypothetical protein
MHDKIKTPLGRHVTISDVATFVIDGALLSRYDADRVRVVRELKRGGLEHSPLYGVLPLSRVRSDGCLIIDALCVFGPKKERLCGRIGRLPLEALCCGSKAVAEPRRTVELGKDRVSEVVEVVEAQRTGKRT